MSFIQPFNRMHTLPKLCLSLVPGILVILFFGRENRSLSFNILLGWDTFCLCSILLFWITFFSLKKQQIRQETIVLQTNAPLIFFLSVLLITASVGIIILLFSEQGDLAPKGNRGVTILVGFGGLVLSWFLLHTLFTIHYAHMYWAPGRKNNVPRGGLQFPAEEHPDYIDFAYFSFVNGMTFQVSDVSVSSQSMRLLVLFHCLLSFAFNTTIVALSINLLAGFV